MLLQTIDKRAFLASAAISIFLGTAPSKASVVINTTTPSSTNLSSQTFSNSGTSLTLSNSNSTGSNPGTINTNSSGLCAWTVVGTSGGSLGRCGYGTNPASGVSSFQLSLNQASFITGFDVSVFESANISQGTIGFSTDNVNFTEVSFTGAGSQSLNFLAGENQTIFVQTSADFNSQAIDTGIFRISSFTVADVPGPLPILGAAAAFGWSRKLKQKTLS
jgi:hypothetical protein